MKINNWYLVKVFIDDFYVNAIKVVINNKEYFEFKFGSTILVNDVCHYIENSNDKKLTYEKQI